MIVYGNIALHPEGVSTSVYKYMSAVLAKGLTNLYVLDDVVYFESDADVSDKVLRGLACMSTLQQIAPYSRIKRPKGLQGKVAPIALQNVLEIVTTRPEAQSKS